MTTGSVTASVRARITANRNSVQPQTKTKIAVAATPGPANGSVIRHNTPRRLQPSTSALSSISCGISTIYPRIIHTVNGSAATAYSTINAWYVSTQLIALNRMNVGKMNETAGIKRWVSSQNERC